MKESAPYMFLIIFCTLICLSNSQCSNILVSDGNYYVFSICMDDCLYSNQITNATAQQNKKLNDCCIPICHQQVKYHTVKRTVIIVIASFLFFLVFLCCIYGCCGPNLQLKWVLRSQRKLRKVQSEGIEPQEFDKLAISFPKNFVQGEQENWAMKFIYNNEKITMNLVQVLVDKKEDYEYLLKMKGDDIFGSWVLDGYFINTEKGPTWWGVKNYTNVSNDDHAFYKENDVIYELTRLSNEIYKGEWHSRDFVEKQGVCWLRRKSKSQYAEGILPILVQSNNEIIEAPQDQKSH